MADHGSGKNEQLGGKIEATQHHQPALIWTAAVAVAALGNWMLFDCMPGINWVLWTTAAVAGLFAFVRQRRSAGAVAFVGGLAMVIAGAAAVTANEVMQVLIVATVLLLLAIQMLLTACPSPRSVTARFAASAPFVALRGAVYQTLRLSVSASHLIRSARARAWVRGVAITLPVLVAFALLLSGADPVFASWREAASGLVSSWEFVPRVLFFVVMLGIVLGAYGYASVEAPGPVPATDRAPVRWWGSTERLMLLGGVAALFWLFLVLQVGYLFGNLPRIASSGMTFAEHARRGFGELSIVASASAALIVVSERFGRYDGHERILRFLTFAVIVAVLLLLGSAFHRVWLYEAAYGFTTARLYAQVYMGGVAAGLGLLIREVAGRFDTGRLFRRAAGAAVILFICLAYWNHEGWIARHNLDRFASTGKLDVVYLTQDLSPDAIPAIAERLPSLPEPVRSEIRRGVLERHATRTGAQERAWFEWNLATSRARKALEASFASPPLRGTDGSSAFAP
ncbi:MAG: DUF4173 domain-containing protein [Gemmatimonadota bacterium]|nr:DUF4173 domain-containing protein [Gemmatimonadota bacterium]